MYEKVKQTKYGYYELKDKPSIEEIQKYYQDMYYQEEKGSYTRTYTEDEIKYFHNKLEQKYLVVAEHLPTEHSKKFLDIGSGEGWALKYFNDKGWDVTGLDFSDFGCNSFNKDVLDKMIVGDIEKSLASLIQKEEKYECIFMLNVLEHVLDPRKLLQNCKELLAGGGIIVIDVPNDFSKLQEILYTAKKVSRPYWVSPPDHISYFNASGLKNLVESVGMEVLYQMASFPVELLLLNEANNYIEDKSKGKDAHILRVRAENFLHENHSQETLGLLNHLSGMGLGRSIVVFVR